MAHLSRVLICFSLILISSIQIVFSPCWFGGDSFDFSQLETSRGIVRFNNAFHTFFLIARALKETLAEVK